MLADRAYSALSYLDAGCARTDWVRIGMAAKAAGLDEASWLDWCATGANYGGEPQSRAVWRSFKATGGIGDLSVGEVQYVEFSDATYRDIVSRFAGPQDNTVYKHLGGVYTSDWRYRAWYTALPEGNRQGIPVPS
jgi:Primase C terminal 2 (PriCT-2)